MINSENIWKIFWEAVVVAAGGGVVTGLVLLVRWFISIGKQIRAISESVSGIASVATATFEMQGPMTHVMRTLVEVTAEQKINGNVEKAHKELSRAEKIHQAITNKSVAACMDDCIAGGIE